MKVEFFYPDVEPLEIDDRNLMGIYEPKEMDESALEPEEVVLRRGFDEPINSPRLSELARGKRDAMVIVDDMTRPTPVKELVPYLVSELVKGGVPEDAIAFMVALGTHRQMTDGEMRLRFGEDLLSRYRFVQHGESGHEACTNLGTTEGGTEIWVNTEVVEASLVVGVGHIVPHRVAGYSGGSKIIQPGVCNNVTTGQTHFLSCLQPGVKMSGVRDNPVRREMDAVGKAVGLAFVANVIHDLRERLVRVVCGDPVEAHVEGCALSRSITEARMPHYADIVITDSYPMDSMLWQAAKGLYAAELAVREGGVIILVSPCPECVADHHPDIVRFGYRPVAETQRLVKEGKIKDLTAAAHIAHLGRIVIERARGILVSPGVPKDVTEKLGMIYAKTPEEALSVAYGIVGEDAKVAVLRRGSEVLPVVAGDTGSAQRGGKDV